MKLKEISKKQAIALASKGGIEIVLINQGYQMVMNGEYVIGGCILAVGAILLVVDQFIE